MRHRSSRALPDYAPDVLSPADDSSLLALSIPLRTITPVVGGGVEAGVPDAIDPVRLPSVRGMLRWWWRALFRGQDPPDALFARETALWGGVDVGSDRVGRRSRVRLRLEHVSPGTVQPAGRHGANSQGSGLKALADWDEPALGYALFPLQRTKDERRDAVRRGERSLPTASVRTDLHFDLHLEMMPAESGRAGREGDVEEVLLALWAWIHLGGIGARTRRGFGALDLRGAVVNHEPSRGAESASLLEAPLSEAWARAMSRCVPGSPLHGGRLLGGRAYPTAQEAHAYAVWALQRFRQVPLGRAKSSNWPEARSLRTLAGISPPSGGDRGAAPRAAFGLPIEVAFLGDADKPAEATLRSAKSNRWASPLILRPVRTGSDEAVYRPIALALSSAPPGEVAVHFKARETRQSLGAASTPPTLPVRAVGGSRPPILERLRDTNGDALEAFLVWLEKQEKFDYVRIDASRRPPR